MNEMNFLPTTCLHLLQGFEKSYRRLRMEGISRINNHINYIPQ